jgi:cytochrome P450
MEALIRERTVRVLDSLPRNETFDWVDSGVDRADHADAGHAVRLSVRRPALLTCWSDVATMNARWPTPTRWTRKARMAELGKMLAYFTRLWNERVNAPPRNDLVSMLAHGPATRNMTPHGVHGQPGAADRGRQRHHAQQHDRRPARAARAPGEWAKLRANPALVDSLVPEIIRWQTPLAYMRRTACRTPNWAASRSRRATRW